MSYIFDTQLLSAEAVNQTPAPLNATLSAFWYSGLTANPTPYDVVLDTVGSCVYGIAFNKLTPTQATSALVAGVLPDGVDSADTAATGTLTFTGNAVYPQPATAQLSARGAGTSGSVIQVNTTFFTLSTQNDFDLKIAGLSGVLGTLQNLTSAINAASPGVVAGYAPSVSAIALVSTLSSFVPNSYVLSSQDANLVFRNASGLQTADYLSGGRVDWVDINGQRYNFGEQSVARLGRVPVGATTDLSITYLISSIGLVSTYVTAASSSAVVGLSAAAIIAGTTGNSYTTTVSDTLSASWGAATLTGGVESTGTRFRAAEAYNGSTFAAISCGNLYSIFTFNSAAAGGLQTIGTFTTEVSDPESIRKRLLGYI